MSGFIADALWRGVGVVVLTAFVQLCQTRCIVYVLIEHH
jgi:hypothetical protein